MLPLQLTQLKMLNFLKSSQSQMGCFVRTVTLSKGQKFTRASIKRSTGGGGRLGLWKSNHTLTKKKAVPRCVIYYGPHGTVCLCKSLNVHMSSSLWASLWRKAGRTVGLFIACTLLTQYWHHKIYPRMLFKRSPHGSIDVEWQRILIAQVPCKEPQSRTWTNLFSNEISFSTV